MKKLYVYGASGHGLVVYDIALACGYRDIEFIDDGDNSYKSFEDIKDDTSTAIAFGIGDNFIREKLFNKVFTCGFEIVSLIHPSAVVSPTCKVGEGSVIMPNTVVNAKSKIGKCTILNTSSVVEHENIIEDFVHLSPSVSLAGNVVVKKLSHVGIGSCVIQNITIGKNSIIGAGSVVICNIENSTLAYGNPCKEIRKIDEQ